MKNYIKMFEATGLLGPPSPGRVKGFWGWKKLLTGKENEIRYHIDQMLIYWLIKVC